MKIFLNIKVYDDYLFVFPQISLIIVRDGCFLAAITFIRLEFAVLFDWSKRSCNEKN